MLQRVALAMLVLSMLATAPSAQDYPQGSVTLIVPYPAGGATDFVARLLQPKLSEALGQPVVIENRPGAGGNVGSAAALRAPPDGRTILLTTNAVMTLNPHLYPDLGFDPLKQAEPVVMTTQSALLLAAHPSLPANSLAELVAYAAKPWQGFLGHRRRPDADHRRDDQQARQYPDTAHPLQGRRARDQ